jgi:hypothetical protein
MPAIALALVAAVLAVQLAAGGGDFAPAQPADPCRTRPAPPVEAALEPLVERVVLAGFDETACALGRSREELVLALADPAKRSTVDAEALQAGLERGIDRIDPLPNVSALLPETLELAGVPGIVQDAADAVPDDVVDDLLPTRELLRRVAAGLDVEAILADLDDPARLEPVLRDAILEAARDQILAGLPEPLRDLIG